jgi:hypothetical protein
MKMAIEGQQAGAEAEAQAELIELLREKVFLFQGLRSVDIATALDGAALMSEKLYSSRPVYTAFRPGVSLAFLYAIASGGPVIVRSTPLDRVIAMTYPGGCFGMQNLAFSYGAISRGFPSLVEAYKTTDIIKIPLGAIETLYQDNASVSDRYGLLFELREKFQYHLLNCSTYPPQAVAALLRALIYQERSLNAQPQANGTFVFDLPIDLIARACQLNHRTVEQVLKGMVKVGLLEKIKSGDCDRVVVADAEGLKGVYGATRDKVDWWPLR